MRSVINIYLRGIRSNAGLITAIAAMALGWSAIDVQLPIRGQTKDLAYETRYFRVDSGNNLLISLTSDQWTSWNEGERGYDESVSRNVGDDTVNSYANWTMGTVPTPGLPNQAPSGITDWALF